MFFVFLVVFVGVYLFLDLFLKMKKIDIDFIDFNSSYEDAFKYVKSFSINSKDEGIIEFMHVKDPDTFYLKYANFIVTMLIIKLLNFRSNEDILTFILAAIIIYFVGKLRVKEKQIIFDFSKGMINISDSVSYPFSEVSVQLVHRCTFLKYNLSKIYLVVKNNEYLLTFINSKTIDVEFCKNLNSLLKNAEPNSYELNHEEFDINNIEYDSDIQCDSSGNIIIKQDIE